MIHVPTSLHANITKACQLLIFMCQRANKSANVSYGASMFQTGVSTCQTGCQFFKSSCQRAKRMPIFRIFLLRNLWGNFYTLLLYKRFYIILVGIIFIYIICICKLHFYTSVHIKEKFVEFFFFIIFSSLLFS